MAIKAILIDSREPPWVQDLTFDSVPKIVTALEFGDAWITTDNGDLIVVERKTPTDLLGSIKDGRVFPQAKGLRERSKWAYVVVTGPLLCSQFGKVIADERVTGWDYNAIQGALLSIQEAGVGIIYCDGDKEYERTLVRLSNRQRTEEVIIEPRQHSHLMSPAEVMLTALPGIGIERAQRLITEFNGRAGEALAWLTWIHPDKCYEIDGIGNGVKKAVRVALKLNDNEQFDLITLQGGK